MYCYKCGIKLCDDAKFCHECGTAVRAKKEAVETISDPEPSIIHEHEPELAESYAPVPEPEVEHKHIPAPSYPEFPQFVPAAPMTPPQPVKQEKPKVSLAFPIIALVMSVLSVIMFEAGMETVSYSAYLAIGLLFLTFPAAALAIISFIKGIKAKRAAVIVLSAVAIVFISLALLYSLDFMVVPGVYVDKIPSGSDMF